MTIFGVKVEDWKKCETFFKEMSKKFKDNNLVRNPFVGKVKRIGDVYVVGIEPIYINFTPYVWMLGGATLLLWGFNWFHFVIIGVGSLSIFWSKYFFYYMLKRGLRKNGYKGKMKLLTNKNIVDGWILKWDNQKS